jgi:WhiB family redox-sensing transcriptional regulator
VPAELNLAKSYCQGCRRRQTCLAGALERAEPAGVWGGEIFEQGRIIETKRPRGRPRKHSAVETGARAS